MAAIAFLTGFRSGITLSLRDDRIESREVLERPRAQLVEEEAFEGIEPPSVLLLGACAVVGGPDEERVDLLPLRHPKTLDRARQGTAGGVEPAERGGGASPPRSMVVLEPRNELLPRCEELPALGVDG